ncbi:MAG: D-2-hydroxyacid dehydrogenase [Acidimicrobiales bacterium]
MSDTSAPTTPTEPVRRVHVFGDRWLPYVSDATLARFDGRELVVLPDDAAFLAAIDEIEVLAGFGMDSTHWAEATSLRMVQWFGAGCDQLLASPDLADDVVIANASGTHEPALPEFVIASLFTLAYRFPAILERQATHTWRQDLPLPPLEGRTVCIVGLGTIGASIARRCLALGMRVVGVRHSGAPVDGVDLVVTPDRIDEVVDGADALVAVAPLTPETEDMIGRAQLAALAPGALVVDVGRGGIMDLDALTDLLDSGHLGGAVVDVFPEEPLPTESPLWDVDKLIVTSHLAGLSREWTDRLFSILADSVDALDAGEDPPAVVDRARGY